MQRFSVSVKVLNSEGGQFCSVALPEEVSEPQQRQASVCVNGKVRDADQNLYEEKDTEVMREKATVILSVLLTLRHISAQKGTALII